MTDDEAFHEVERFIETAKENLVVA